MYRFEAEGDRAEGVRSVNLASHVDTLGAIVRRVEKDKVKFDGLGGYPPEYVIGNCCTIHTFDGREISGTILPGNPSVHVNKDLKEKKLKQQDLVVRMDLRLRDDEDGLNNYIEVGNFISFDPGFEVVNGFVKTRHLDDKASAAILLLHLRSLLSKIN